MYAAVDIQVVESRRHRRRREAALQSLAGQYYQAFFRLFPPARNYRYGRHTLATLDVLDDVVNSVRHGRSRYVILNMPFRHGKSDLGSRRWAPYIFASEPEDGPRLEVLLASYNFEKAAELSYDARRCFQEAGGQWGRYVSDDQDKVAAWTTTRGDTLYAAGIGGTITGRGANYLIIDDYYKNRVEAESSTMRDRVRDSFRSDMLTRLAPVHAVVIIANCWHPDGLCTWLQRCSTPGTSEYNPEFPAFEVYKFPAQDGRWATPANPDGWLFTERYAAEWYQRMRAGMSAYQWQAQAQQDPRPRQGTMLRSDRVVVLEAAEFYELANRLSVQFRRGWDTASSEEETDSDDPDYTVGTLAGYVPGKIFVDDVVRLRARAPERDRVMLNTALSDGPGVPVRVEAVAGYKDTADRMARKLAAYATVEKIVPDRDKVARASVLEAPFEAGQVYIKRAAWNAEWLAEAATFPARGRGLHCDQVDSLGIAVYNEIMELAQFTMEVW